jgi:uncharacterized membrane protein
MWQDSGNNRDCLPLPIGEKTLAGQPPQEPPWQPQGQDDGRQGWQAYSPPSAADGQETYAYPQSGATPAPGYGQGYAQDRAAFAPPAPETRIEAPETRVEAPETRMDTSFTRHDQSYPGANQSYVDADQTYIGANQPYAGANQPYAGAPGPDQGTPQWQDQSAPQWQDQSAPQWQSQAASQWKAQRQGSGKATNASKGFVASLFDFSFTSFVTPKIIKALYVLVTIWTAIWALIFLGVGFKYGGAAGGFFTLIVVVPVFGLITLGTFRMLLEFFMVSHRIHEELKAIRERSDDRL